MVYFNILHERKNGGNGWDNHAKAPKPSSIHCIISWFNMYVYIYIYIYIYIYTYVFICWFISKSRNGLDSQAKKADRRGQPLRLLREALLRYMYMYIYIYIYIHTYIYIYICIHIHTYTHIYIHVSLLYCYYPIIRLLYYSANLRDHIVYCNMVEW